VAHILLTSIHPTHKRGVTYVSLTYHASLISDYSSISKYLLTRKCDIALEGYHIVGVLERCKCVGLCMFHGPLVGTCTLLISLALQHTYIMSVGFLTTRFPAFIIY